MATAKIRGFIGRFHIGLLLVLAAQYAVFFVYPEAAAMLWSVLFLHASVMLILISPVGEWFLRVAAQTEPMRQDMEDYLRPILNDVIASAQTRKPLYHGKITLLFLKTGLMPGATAIGRRTIAVTASFIDMSYNEQEALLAQEVAHLVLHHNIMLLAASPLLIMIWFVLQLYGIIFKVIGLVISVFSRGGLLVSVIGFLPDLIARLFNMICVLLLAIETRSNTYAADRFVLSMNQDYALSLCDVLDNNPDSNAFLPNNGFFASMAMSKPSANARIRQMIECGVPYSRY